MIKIFNSNSKQEMPDYQEEAYQEKTALKVEIIEKTLPINKN